MKPILFNTEMVRAILEGRKTVTRRVCKFPMDSAVTPMDFGCAKKPPFDVNDILYVRETWNWYYTRSMKKQYIYRATNENISGGQNWKPSIHMPREAARIFLRVTDVRVERLHDMEFKDYEAEGMRNPCDSCAAFPISVGFPIEKCDTCANDSIMALSFIALWNDTIKKDQLQYYGWNANPYVWVIEFERVDLDSLGGANE